MAARSVLVNIHNNTSKTLELDAFNTTLQHGIWTPNVEPPQTIFSMQTRTFKAESEGFLTGTEGRVNYRLAGDPQSSVFFYFSNPYSGSNTFHRSAYSAMQLLQYEFQTNSGDNAVVDLYLNSHDDGVIVYEHADYNGRSQHFPPGKFDVTQLGWIANDTASSIQIAPHHTVSIFEHAGFVNQMNQFAAGDRVLGISHLGDANDRLSSITVDSTPPVILGGAEPIRTESNLKGVIVFEHADYNQGTEPGSAPLRLKRSQFFGPGRHNLTGQQILDFTGRGPRGMRFGVAPNQLSSLKVGTGFTVELFDKPNQQGETLPVVENTPRIRSDWNDRVQSLIVNPVQQPR